MSENGKVFCSFCGGRQDYVSVMVAGPHGVFICDECVEMCVDIIEKTQAESRASKEAHRIEKRERE